MNDSKARAGWFDSHNILAGCINLHPDGLYRVRCLSAEATDADEQLEALTFTSIKEAHRVVNWVYGNNLRWVRITDTLEFINEFVLNGVDPDPRVNAAFWAMGGNHIWLD